MNETLKVVKQISRQMQFTCACVTVNKTLALSVCREFVRKFRFVFETSVYVFVRNKMQWNCSGGREENVSETHSTKTNIFRVPRLVLHDT